MKNFIKKLGTGLAVVASVAMMSCGLTSLPVSAATDCDPNNPSLSQGVNCGRGEETPEELTGDGGIITTVINTMLFIVGILSVVMIIFAGIRYVTAHGDKGQVEGAKNTLIYAIVGLIVSIVAYALVNWVTGLWSNN